MAKSKEQLEEQKKTIEANDVSSTNSNASIPSTEDLLKIISGLQEQIANLSSKVNENEVLTTDFIIGMLWDDLQDNIDNTDKPPKLVIENSRFAAELTSEEINILAILMMVAWVQRQVTSIENTRMKYSGSDFKMTSQANHLSKLQSLLNECNRQSLHMQRLYKRRKIAENGEYQSNWSVLREKSTFN